MTDPDHVVDLQQVLSATAEQLVRRGGPGGEEADETLLRLTSAAADHVPGAAFAGLTMRGPRGELVSRAPSHPAIEALDRAQVELAEGPCIDALSVVESTETVVEDFAVEHRWPRFTPRARDAGIGGLLSFALAPINAAPAALNLYFRAGRPIDPAARAVAAAFATQASVAVYGARRIEQLHRALAGRDVIGQAKGVLMERFTMDDQQAFDLLVRTSQDTNMKLLDVARWLSEEAGRRAQERQTRGADGVIDDAGPLGVRGQL